MPNDGCDIGLVGQGGTGEKQAERSRQRELRPPGVQVTAENCVPYLRGERGVRQTSIRWRRPT